MWSGLAQKDQIEIAGLKVRLPYASFVTGAAYLLFNFNVAIVVSLVRIKALLTTISDESFLAALTLVTTHSCLLNPYAFFGAGDISSTINGLGFGGLVGLLVGGLDYVAAFMLKRAITKMQTATVATDDPLPAEATPSLRAQAAAPTSKDLADESNEVVVMKGLPFHLSGWNGRYHRLRALKSDRSVWARPEHWFTGFLPLTNATPAGSWRDNAVVLSGTDRQAPYRAGLAGCSHVSRAG